MTSRSAAVRSASAAAAVLLLGTCAPVSLSVGPAASSRPVAAAGAGADTAPGSALRAPVARTGTSPKLSVQDEAAAPPSTELAPPADVVDSPGSLDSGVGSGPAGSADTSTFAPIVAQQPKLRVQAPDAGAEVDQIVERVRGVDGVAHAAGMLVATTEVGSGAGLAPVTVAAVDPEDFRVLTPQITADAVAVWERLTEGDVAFTHDVGYRLQLELGSQVSTSSLEPLRVGALASNGVPPVADAILSRDRAAELALTGDTEVLVAVEQGTSPVAVAERLTQSGLEVEILPDPTPRRAFLTGSDARSAFEPYTYVDNGDGMIQIDPGWVSRNIVRARVPILTGEVICHRLMVDQLHGALQELVDLGLDGLIDPTQYGGCWVPRHIDFNPTKPLSMHSWGLAVDFNVSTNGLGKVPTMDPRVVEVFDRWGFVWGGRWQRPDGMHFELGAVLRSVEG